MRFFANDSTKKTRVRWSFIAADVPSVGRVGNWGPRNWDLSDAWQEFPLGELRRRSWKNGLPKQQFISGKTPCGSIDEWLNGADATQPVQQFWTGTHTPICCPFPPLYGDGGEAIGGADGIAACPSCGDPPLLVFLRFSVSVVACPLVDGLVVPLTLTAVPCCTPGFDLPLWESEIIPFPIGPLRFAVTCGQGTGALLAMVICDATCGALNEGVNWLLNGCNPLDVTPIVTSFAGFVVGCIGSTIDVELIT
jgi:hypothetical protein